jgi:hypothetical protein
LLQSLLRIAVESRPAAESALTAASYPDDPVQGGYNCPGKIKRVWCYENLSGVLTGIITENESTGRSSFCNAGVSGQQPTRLLTLADNENIIRITACRGAYYGYTKVTFDTAKGQSITCGSAAYAYKPDNYQSYAASYTTKGWRRPDSESMVRPNRTRSSNNQTQRNLLEDAAAASTATAVTAAAVGGASAAALGPASSSSSSTGMSAEVLAVHTRRGEERRRMRAERDDPERFFRANQGWGWNR